MSIDPSGPQNHDLGSTLRPSCWIAEVKLPVDCCQAFCHLDFFFGKVSPQQKWREGLLGSNQIPHVFFSTSRPSSLLGILSNMWNFGWSLGNFRDIQWLYMAFWFQNNSVIPIHKKVPWKNRRVKKHPSSGLATVAVCVLWVWSFLFVICGFGRNAISKSRDPFIRSLWIYVHQYPFLNIYVAQLFVAILISTSKNIP